MSVAANTATNNLPPKKQLHSLGFHKNQQAQEMFLCFVLLRFPVLRSY